MALVSLNFQKDILAKDIMTRDVISLSPDDSLLEAYQKLSQHKFSGLPVVENAVVVGMITAHDILAKGGGVDMSLLVNRVLEQRLSGSGESLEAQLSDLLLTVGKVMNNEPVILSEDTPFPVVYETFKDNREVSSIPVVKIEGELVGIISRSDVVRFIGDMFTLPVGLGSNRMSRLGGATSEPLRARTPRRSTPAQPAVPRVIKPQQY